MPRLIGGEGILYSRPEEEKIVQMHANVNVRHKGRDDASRLALPLFDIHAFVLFCFLLMA